MVGPLVLVFPPHWDSHVSLGGRERGASGNADKDEKGVSTKLAAPVSSHPNTMGDQARPRACAASGHQVQGPPHLFCLL